MMVISIQLNGNQIIYNATKLSILTKITDRNTAKFPQCISSFRSKNHSLLNLALSAILFGGKLTKDKIQQKHEPSTMNLNCKERHLILSFPIASKSEKKK